MNKSARAGLKSQRPYVLWFTGLPGAGKSTISALVEKKLHEMGRHTYRLDGDVVRTGLNSDLGFSREARAENIRRISEVGRLMVDAGLIVIVAAISPFRAERDRAKALFEPDEFLEIFVDTPLEVAEARDPKGHYRRARRGEINNFTGVDSPYETPERPFLALETVKHSAEALADRVITSLR